MVTRRRLLSLSAKGVVALMTVFPTLVGCARKPAAGEPEDSDPADSGGALGDSGDTGGAVEALSYADLLSQVAALATVQYSADWDQAAYVADVAALMAALDLDDPDLLALYAEYADRYRDFPEITTVEETDDFEVAILQFEAGDSIDLHDHPDMTGVILCVSGAVQIENYTELSEQSADGNPLIQQIWAGTLSTGQVGTLTATTGNIHTLRADVFTELLDVFTPGYNRDRSLRSRWFTRAETPYDDRSDVYEAYES